MLYFTYYSLLTLEKLGDSFNLDDEVLEETICNISIESFVKDNYFDNLSNLYYFVEIVRMMKLHIDEKDALFIREYVSGLQTNEGCFALSNKQKQKIDDKQYKAGEYNETFLGTFMALEILSRVECDMYDRKNLNAWVENKFYELKVNPTYDQLPYIMLLVKIDNIIGNSDNEHVELLGEIYDRSLDYLIRNYDKNKSFDIFFMNDALETSILLDKSAEFIDKTMYMAGYYSFLQNENDGCFGADSQSESNILPTYCAVNYYNLTGVKEYKQEAIVETMKACQTIEGYYLPIMERDSDLESTYYAYKILKLIHSQSDYEEKIKKFISNQELSSICQNQADLLFYYKLNDELYGKNELCDVSVDLIQKLKVSLRENDLSNQYFSLQAVNSLETLKMFDEKADDETSEKIVENIKKRGVEKTESDYLTECYDLLILKLIDYNDADGMIIEKSERVKETLIEGYKEIDQEYRLFYLYWGIRSLSGWNIEIAELLDYDVIEEEILEYENNAVYSIGKDDYPSLSSTYYCLYIMQNKG